MEVLCSLPGAIYWALCPLARILTYNFCSLPGAIYWALSTSGDHSKLCLLTSGNNNIPFLAVCKAFS
ncbi:hypothetical protein DPMN_013186 [Dreissena polymorpha]|uniref:Uncharacterized protein n=1 Tax=Dreissena polymorpha TaxID=45954 RepID=A0A9D4N7A5_DREPO|nr:hypothetical protein DPMN_013186 [Dreissena polymorpha]